MTKKKDKGKGKSSQQQKPPSPTVRKVTQPAKPPEPSQAPPPDVNLCDDCAYEFGECGGKPTLAEGTDRVVNCDTWVNVGSLPSVDEAAGKSVQGVQDKQEPAQEHAGVEEYAEAILSIKDGDEPEPETPAEVEAAIQADERLAEAAKQKAAEDETKRKKLQRFQRDEDFGTCPACGQKLKRTAFNSERDAVRCVNGRCNQYRQYAKLITAE
ncbi:MAG: hypothetical protein WC329_01735 [Candidatus Omnitrophota bacterium]|jgi:hypothetical protein